MLVSLDHICCSFEVYTNTRIPIGPPLHVMIASIDYNIVPAARQLTDG